MKGYGPKIVLEAKATNKTYLDTLLTLFKEDVEKEYRELAEECDEFLEEIRKNLRTGNVTQTEVSELEEALEGLERWLIRIKSRNFIGSTAKGKIHRLLSRCRSALLSFSEKAQPKRMSEVPKAHR
jgi:DNA-binding transcriptional regulator GbsR (MarR family)